MTQSSSNSSSDPPEPKTLPTWARPVLEFGPLILFFVVQRTTERLDGLYWATVSLMITTSLSVIISRVLEKRWPPVPLITGIFVGIMGGLTLYMNSELFIKIKPTLVYGTFGLVLLGGLARGRVFLRSIFGASLPIQDEGWTVFTKRLGYFCFLLALGNEVLRVVLDTDDWTTAKTFGYGPAWLVFLLAQGPLFEKYSIAEESEETQKETEGGPKSGPE